jgi:8-oxo-dGTP pyrophosphatase MutT (NUDIX family)
MVAERIRPIAICVFRRDGRILVFEGRDSAKEQTFYRPIGGGIEFGETSAAAMIREIREEISAEVVDLEYIGTLENIFTHNGAARHEIIQVYDGRLADEALYSSPSIPGVESNGAPIHVVWKPLNSFSAQVPLYPDGLLELLSTRQA